MSITVESQAKVYLEGTMVVFRNEENNLVRSESPGNIYYSAYKEGVIFYVKGESRQIMAVAAWNQVLNQAGTAYGADQAAVETALNDFLGFKKGGGGDLAYTQNKETTIGTSGQVRDSITMYFEPGKYIITANIDVASSSNTNAFFNIQVDAVNQESTTADLTIDGDLPPLTIETEVTLSGEQTVRTVFGRNVAATSVNALFSSLKIAKSPNE